MASALFAELKRRKVVKVGAVYLVSAWLAVQAASIGFPAFEAPAWVLRVFILVLLLGFPIVMVLTWVLELTPDGMRLEASPVGNKRALVSWSSSNRSCAIHPRIGNPRPCRRTSARM